MTLVDRFEAFALAVIAWSLATGRRLAALRQQVQLQARTRQVRRVRRRLTVSFDSGLLGDTRAQSSGDSQAIVKAGAGVAASGGLVALIRDYYIGGALYAASIETVEFIQAVGSIGRVFSEFAGGLADIVAAALPDEIILAGVRSSAAAVYDYGIASFVIAIAATMVGVALFLRFVANIEWSPLKLFFGGRE